MKKPVISQTTLKAFEKYLHEDEKSEATLKKYLHDICVFMQYTDKHPIDKEQILEYKRWLLQKYSLSSANSMLASLNTFFRFLNCPEFCVRQFKVQKAIYTVAEKELSKKEYVRLVETARAQGNERLEMLLQTICATGIRVSELQFVTVEALRQTYMTVFCKGKSRKVFLATDLCKKLLGYAKKQGICAGGVFVTKSGAPLNRSNIWRDMKKLCRQANVSEDKVFPHNLRHLFARTFYKQEKDMAKLSDVLGHTSINTTRIYIISTGSEHRRCVDSMRLTV